jgi:hypothetical protein
MPFKLSECQQEIWPRKSGWANKSLPYKEPDGLTPASHGLQRLAALPHSFSSFQASPVGLAEVASEKSRPVAVQVSSI